MDDCIDQIHHHASRSVANYQLQRETKLLILYMTIIVKCVHARIFSFFHVELISTMENLCIEYELFLP